ncbi:MAG: hypothetical protein J0M00_09550 [Burkholderiales bacterium]|nr:hypothetical protein [Burkholderiales bacterium]
MRKLDFYSTGLLWRGRRGVAKLYGREVVLTQAPKLSGKSVTMIEYWPEIGMQRIQTSDGPAREMNPFEVAEADDFLRLVTGSER